MAIREQGRVPRVLLYTKSDCELCQEAKASLMALQGEFAFELAEIDITADPALYEAFHLEIPVGYLDGRKLFKYRVDPARLRRRLWGSAGGRIGR
jgi:hypothetical protein